MLKTEIIIFEDKEPLYIKDTPKTERIIMQALSKLKFNIKLLIPSNIDKTPIPAIYVHVGYSLLLMRNVSNKINIIKASTNTVSASAR